MERIAKGYRYFQENSSTHYGADDGNKYINSIIKEINNLTDNMNNSLIIL
jgi:hypothetical protein